MSGSNEGYQSLSAVSREQRVKNAANASNNNNNNAARAGIGAATSTNVPAQASPLRKMVRMASDLLLPSSSSYSAASSRPGAQNRTSSGNVPKLDYGTSSHRRNESAIAEEDEDATSYYDEEEQWGNWRLIMLTIGLAGAQLAWTIELG